MFVVSLQAGIDSGNGDLLSRQETALINAQISS